MVHIVNINQRIQRVSSFKFSLKTVCYSQSLRSRLQYGHDRWRITSKWSKNSSHFLHIGRIGFQPGPSSGVNVIPTRGLCWKRRNVKSYCVGCSRAGGARLPPRLVSLHDIKGQLPVFPKACGIEQYA